ncbi:MAG: hypothetical protein AB7S78_07985 [Candidatus Omnitrophota bacterium]
MGLPFAERLLTEGYAVKGSTTQDSKMIQLRNAGIEPFLLKCSPKLEGEDFYPFFHSDVLFLTIPFKRDLIDPFYYYDQIQSIISEVNRSSIKFVVFSSSTAIYRSSVEVASEWDPIDPDNPRSHVLHKIEQLLINNKNFQSTIIRFAGLYGGERHLGRFPKTPRIKGRNGQSLVNLIHLDDCIEIVFRIIHNNVTGEIFNAVSDSHPTRQELYTRKAMELGIEPPVFDQCSGEIRKIVSNKKLKDALNYQFIHPDPLK